MNGRIANLSIVIPAYNEQERIVDTLYRLFVFCKHNFLNWEIIVVDDGSKIPIIECIKVALHESNIILDKHIKIIRLEKNMGKGFAVRTGTLAAKYKWTLFTDADLSTPIIDFYKLEKYHTSYDIIIGSRKELGANITESQNRFRVALGNVFPFLVENILDLGIKDTQCGFKLMKTEIAQDFFKAQRIHRFAFDAEFLYLAKLYNVSVKEVGVHWKNDIRSKVNLFKDVPNMFFSLYKIRMEHDRRKDR